MVTLREICSEYEKIISTTGLGSQDQKNYFNHHENISGFPEIAQLMHLSEETRRNVRNWKYTQPGSQTLVFRTDSETIKKIFESYEKLRASNQDRRRERQTLLEIFRY